MNKSSALRALLAVTALTTAMSGLPLAAYADALPAIKERGTLRVGMSAAYKPFEYVEGDQIVGFDPDVIAIIAEKLGVEAELIDTNWAGVVPSLYANKFDIIISAMTATPERAERVLFTQPYGEQTFYFMTSEDDPATTAKDFDGRTVAAEGGGAAQTGIEQWVADGHISFADQVYLSNPNEAYLAVKVGRADAAVDGLPGLMAFQQENPGFKLIEGFGPKQVMVMAIRKEDRDLCLAVNDVISEMKADGALEAIQLKWFGQAMPAESELPEYLGASICGEP